MRRFMLSRKIRDWTKWTQKQLLVYTHARVQHMLEKDPKAKAYKFINIKNILTSTFRFAAPVQFMKYKSVITKVINSYSKSHFMKHKGGAKHAKVFSWQTIKTAAGWLAKKDMKSTKMKPLSHYLLHDG